jgi:hypothetical protein
VRGVCVGMRGGRVLVRVSQRTCTGQRWFDGAIAARLGRCGVVSAASVYSPSERVSCFELLLESSCHVGE